MMKAKKLVLVVLMTVMATVQPSQDVMKTITINFGKPLEACKKELDLPDAVTKEFLNFWKDGYEITNRLTGCAIMCLSNKLDLVEDESLHHGRAKEYAMKHGADAGMAQQLVDLLHGCITSAPAIADHCQRTVGIAMCFKHKIHELNWAPDPDLIIAEIMADSS